jgi:two-component system NtrC family response regulator
VQAIEAYAWPGNVRELENKIKGAVIMADGKMVTAADLGLKGGDEEVESLNLREVRQVAETKAIRVALTKSYGNISKAADLLGVTRPTLYDLLNKRLSTSAPQRAIFLCNSPKIPNCDLGQRSPASTHD